MANRERYLQYKRGWQKRHKNEVNRRKRERYAAKRAAG